jgi:hypothetical protein
LEKNGILLSHFQCHGTQVGQVQEKTLSTRYSGHKLQVVFFLFVSVLDGAPIHHNLLLINLWLDNEEKASLACCKLNEGVCVCIKLIFHSIHLRKEFMKY